MAEDILNLMVAQHAFLESIFFIFQNEMKNNSEKAKDSLSEFVWESKKHFFVEEEVIFNFMAWKEPKILETINQLKIEHSIMIDKLEKMEQYLSAVSTTEIENFYKLLTGHGDIEEKNLYPKLDESLSNSQKLQIIKRATQIKK
jgi:hemerythrin superfamily protein